MLSWSSQYPTKSSCVCKSENRKTPKLFHILPESILSPSLFLWVLWVIRHKNEVSRLLSKNVPWFPQLITSILAGFHKSLMYSLSGFIILSFTSGLLTMPDFYKKTETCNKKHWYAQTDSQPRALFWGFASSHGRLDERHGRLAKRHGLHSPSVHICSTHKKPKLLCIIGSNSATFWIV